jgi:hypothetical protein
MIRMRPLLVVSVVSLALLGSRTKCGFAGALIQLDSGTVSQDNAFSIPANQPGVHGFAVASQDLTNGSTSGNSFAGHGTTIGVAFQVIRGVNPIQGQWRLTNGNSFVEVMVNANSSQSTPARLHTWFEGFDPSALGYRPSAWTAGSPSYAALLSAAQPITITGVSYASHGSVDVTNYMHSLPSHSDAMGTFVDPGFVMALADGVAINGAYVLFTGLFLEYRDGSAALPWLPTTSDGTTSHFDSVPSNAWCDPAIASGFDYRMTDGSLFTKIVSFPTGFNSAFTVSVGDTVLGQFSPGQSVDFTSFLGGGVSSFRVSGISPFVDPNNQLAFPLQLQFNNQTASFDMLAAPEPSSAVLAGLAIVALFGFVWRRKRSA